MTTKASSDRMELLQGTLDMLILRTLLFGPAHGHAIAKHILHTTDEVLQVSTARCIRRSTAWSARAGSEPNGKRRRAVIASSNTTGSRQQAGSSWPPKNQNGSEWRALLRG